MSILKRKNLNSMVRTAKASELRHNLTYVDITLFGIGAVVGTGIFVLTGIGAAKYAGPGMTLSFIFAGLTCGFVALAYAELTAMLPVTGSVYTYTYSIFGEIIAWIVGWALVLEYSLAAAVVSAGWSAYVTSTLKQFNVVIPKVLSTSIWNGGIVDLPGALIIIVLTFLLVRGTKESAKVSRILVGIKLGAIFIFLFLAAPKINVANWTPFLPFGVNGIFTGASFAFFAFLGFDVLSNMSEETVKPSRDLPVGIICTLITVTILYMAVSAVLTGVVKYTELDTAAPVVFALEKVGYRFGSAIVGTGIIFGLTTVVLVAMYGLNRMFLAMSRDGLIPLKLCKIHSKYRTPYIITIICGVMIVIAESALPVDILAELINLGTLFAFMLASAGIFALRLHHPEIERPFKCPYPFVIMPLAIVCCGYLMIHLNRVTWLFFIYWTIFGLMIYMLFGYWNSRLHRASEFGKIRRIAIRIKSRYERK